jgi:hypothetical protein
LDDPEDSAEELGTSSAETPGRDFFYEEPIGPFTREQRRSRRKRPVRARTINVARLAKSALEVGRLLQPEMTVERPRTRADCNAVPRPCPFVGCRHHLYLDVSERTGSIKLNFPDLEVWELEESCSLDVADRGSLKQEQLGAVMNVTRERIRQLEQRSLSELNRQLEPVTEVFSPSDGRFGQGKAAQAFPLALGPPSGLL